MQSDYYFFNLKNIKNKKKKLVFLNLIKRFDLETSQLCSLRNPSSN
jgi:hypothetical protein